MAKTPAIQPKLKPGQYQASIREKLDKLSTDLYPIVEDLQGRKDEQTLSSLQWYLRLGRKLNSIKKKADATKGPKASVYFRAIGVALELNPTDANAASRFAIRYPDEASVKALLQVRTITGKPLQWSHIRLLVSSDIDEQARLAYIEQIAAENWSAEELSQAIQQALGERPGKGGGRPISAPKNIGSGLLKREQQVGVFIKYSESVYAKDGGFKEMIEGTPGNKMTPEMLVQIDRLTGQLRKLEQSISPELANLTKLRGYVSNVLDGKPAAAVAQADADDADEEESDDRPEGAVAAKPVVSIGKSKPPKPVQQDDQGDKPQKFKPGGGGMAAKAAKAKAKAAGGQKAAHK